MSLKKRVNVMLHHRLTEGVVDLAKALDSSPNDVVNRIVEGALGQIAQPKKPVDPIPIVNLARTILRKNLGYGDRLLQKFLESSVAGWAAQTEEWRETYLRLANDVEGELTNAELERLKRRADKICADKNR